MLKSCTAERDAVQELITGAGLTFGYTQNGKTKARLELESPKISVPLKINVTELMAELLPDSPSWYNIGSSVTHSLYWGLRDVDRSRRASPWPSPRTCWMWAPQPSLPSPPRADP